MTRVGAATVAELVPHVPPGERFAAARVALGIAGQEDFAELPDAAERRREPAREHRVDDRLQAALADRRGSLAPRLGLAEARGRRGEHEFLDAFGRVEREPHTDGAAERQTDDGERVGPGLARTCAARSSIARTSVTGAPPWPGCSTLTTRRPSSTGSCDSHIADVEPSDPHRTTVALIGATSVAQ